MVERVLMGQRGSEMGLWISKPGKNVLTASESDMLFLATPTRQTKALQLVQQGTLSFAQGQEYVDIVTPNLGFNPLAGGFFYGAIGFVWVSYPGFGVVRFSRNTTYIANAHGPFYYFVSNLKVAF